MIDPSETLQNVMATSTGLNDPYSSVVGRFNENKRQVPLVEDSTRYRPSLLHTRVTDQS